MPFAPGSGPGRSQAQFPRRKLWAPKVKTGCLTCRRRRVKCDEGKPSCKRCLVSRQECVYSSPSPPALPSPESTNIPPELDFKSSPMYKNASQSERDAFFRFYTVATEQIAGSGDHDFWATVVPQLAQMYPPVWHAVNAMSTVYAKERIRGGDDVAKQNRNQYYQFALEQYGKSVEETLAVSKMNMEVIDKEVILTTSIIMCCMALLMADRKMAVQHSWHAFRLFRQWSEDGQSAGIDTGVTQGFLTKMLKDYPVKLAQQSTAPGRNGEAAVQRMSYVDEIQEPTTGCALIVELWSFDFEAEFHISFATGPEITYDMFLNDFEAILELGWQSFHQRKDTQSREMRLVLQAVIGASQTKTIYTHGPDLKCANPNDHDGESVMLQYPWPSDFFDVKVILDNIAQGSMAQCENLMWSGLVGLGSCECSDDEVCGEHRVTGTGVRFLEEEGIHAVLNAVSRVVGNRPGQHIRLRW